MKYFLNLIFLLFVLQLYSQNYTDFHKVEEQILLGNLDSASYFLEKAPNNSYKDLLIKINNKKNLSYSEYNDFTSKLLENKKIDFDLVSDYLNKKVKEPENKKKINLDYVYLKWVQISVLRDELFVENASEEQIKLERYINKFDADNTDVLNAKTRIKTHNVVMLMIEKDLKNGKKLALESLKTAENLKDISLQISFLSLVSDFLIYENKVGEFIKISERCLELEKELPKKSFYYYSTISHLIDAYIYKGGYRNRVKKLIDELYHSSAKNISSIFYAQLVSKLDKNDALLQEILNKFEAENISELTANLLKLGESLNLNEFYRLVNMSSIALAKHGFYDEALQYKSRAVEITRKIYSEDLSASIAKHKTKEAVKAKELEIETQKELKRLYVIIAILCFIFLIKTFFILLKLRKQSTELGRKNILINKSLKEKELLIKEVHHRVKNNFQIITSLLELDKEKIKDPEALQIINKGKARVKSMALIHQKLYKTENGFFNFSEFTNLLYQEISSIYKGNKNVKFILEAKDFYFDVDTTIPLALILNEIITNAYKYAFYADKKNKLFISLKKVSEENYDLIIQDNGQGINTDFKIEKVKSSGLKLVTRLVKQLQGTLRITNNSGAKFQIIFKDSKSRKEVL